MDYTRLALHVGLTLVAGLATVSLFGLLEQKLRAVNGNFFALLLRPTLLVSSGLESFWGGVKEFYNVQFTVNGRLDLQTVFFQFIGATLYTLFFLAFNFSEFHLLALSLVAAGVDVGHFSSPIGAGALTAFAIIASILFWGAVICDLAGLTNTAPWREALKAKWRQYLLYLTLFSLGLSVFVSASMGLFRGKVIAEKTLKPPAYSAPTASGFNDLSTGYSPMNNAAQTATAGETDGLYYWIPIIANVSIPILVCLGGIFSSWGLVTMIKFFMLIAAFVIISPLGLLLLACNLSMNIIDRLYQFADALLQLLAAMGQKFMGLFGWKPPEVPENEDKSDINGQSTEGLNGDAATQEKCGTPNEHDTMDPPQDAWAPFN